jgi:hypothetical protein
MTCYQSTNLPGGVTTTGRTSYTTEADCLNACKEGACCEGASCKVKPQCQCQGTGQTFKGVGTTCSEGLCNLCNPDGSPKPPYLVQWCWCFCGEGLAAYPQFMNLSLNIDYTLGRVVNEVQQSKSASASASITLAAQAASSSTSCPYWAYGVIGGRRPQGNYVYSQYLPIGRGEGAVEVRWRYVSLASVAFDVQIEFRDFSEVDPTDPFVGWKTGAGITGSPYGDAVESFVTSLGVQKSGVCFSDIVGSSISKTMPPGVTSGTSPIVPGQGNMSWRVSVAGVQA